ncbi:sulfite exporter TauE/SafE family protein [Streptomyces sp. NPDC059474]|uniref:sulfite exporter TauE/SafE family protein n=1 Tax=Streptomyces sp. NPDC059474 TaxID=3346846 RepID=UPI0036C79464
MLPGCSSVYGGYFGGAMGVIMLVALALATTDGLRRLNALKAALSLVDSTISLLIFALWGPVDWLAVAVAAPTALIGGYFGARLARRLNEEVLRWLVVAVGLAVSIALFIG